MKEIKFKEIDSVGNNTLDIISNADKFNHWMYQTIKPHCKGLILEIGSGLGNISQFFLKDKAIITLSDIRQNYFEELSQSLGHYPNLQGIQLIDLVDLDFDTKFQHLFDSFDTLFALNVVEHIYDDNLAIQNCYKLLKKGGQLIILVPSYQCLYNALDESLDHYRRYNKKKLSTLLATNKLAIKQQYCFNFMGIFAWFISGKLQRNNTIPARQMHLYNTFVPIFRLVDKILFRKWGLSTIVVGEK